MKNKVSCILFALVALTFSVTTGAKAIGQLGQSPVPYDPKYMSSSDGDRIEFVRSTPQGLVGSDRDFDRILFGYQKDGFGAGQDFGIKVSQPGHSVYTATNGDLIFNSGNSLFQVLYEGELVLHHPAGILGTGDYGVNPIDYVSTPGSTPAIVAFVYDPASSLAGTEVVNPGETLPIGTYYPLNYSTISMSVGGVITSHLELTCSVSQSQTLFFMRAQQLTSGNPWTAPDYNLYIKYYLLGNTLAR